MLDKEVVLRAAFGEKKSNDFRSSGQIACAKLSLLGVDNQRVFDLAKYEPAYYNGQLGYGPTHVYIGPYSN